MKLYLMPCNIGNCNAIQIDVVFADKASDAVVFGVVICHRDTINVLEGNLYS